MKLSISKGKSERARRIVIYGPEGIGKSTLASHFPRPIFIDTEKGSGNLDVDRIDDIENWKSLGSIIAEIVKNHRDDYKTIVIDTIDWLEGMCIRQVCSENNKNGIEDFGYGKGYTYLSERFNRFLTYLSEVNESGIHVVLCAHSTIKKFEQPGEVGAYDRFEMKLSKKCMPLVKEWCEMLLFLNYETSVIEVSGKHIASGGKRVIHTVHNPCWDAKNRSGLPEVIEFEKNPRELIKLLGVDKETELSELKKSSTLMEDTDDIPMDYNDDESLKK